MEASGLFGTVWVLYVRVGELRLYCFVPANTASPSLSPRWCGA